ncbi:MAG: hypothetical protein RL150_655 [Candidatus Parcubacteria bacterium]|jgi:Fur family ferric uptake transcriptional regulator
MAKKQQCESGVGHVDVRSLLQMHAFKVTKQRVAVLEHLQHAHGPCTIEDIAHAVPAVNQVTVYRMLKQFVDAGIIYQTDFRSGKAYFEFQEHHHHHVVCTSCGAQEAVEACLPASFVDHVSTQTKHFASVAHHALEFFGTCKRCAK